MGGLWDNTPGVDVKLALEDSTSTSSPVTKGAPEVRQRRARGPGPLKSALPGDNKGEVSRDEVTFHRTRVCTSEVGMYTEPASLDAWWA